MAEIRLLMMIDQVGQARQQPPQNWNRYGRLSTRIVVLPYTISVQRLEMVMDFVSEFSCTGTQKTALCWRNSDPILLKQSVHINAPVSSGNHAYVFDKIYTVCFSTQDPSTPSDSKIYSRPITSTPSPDSSHNSIPM